MFVRSIIVLCATSIALGACGIKRPLIKPADIPAYEQERQKKQQERDDFRRENAA
jgi:predicted small lipoprotein YifL